jgi:hypothetical protein
MRIALRLLSRLGVVTWLALLTVPSPGGRTSVPLANAEYKQMSERRVGEVFRDRLDLFPRSQVPRLTRHFMSLCRKYQFDPAFILSLIEVESRFRVRVISNAGAVGLMQVMPATAAAVVAMFNLDAGSRVPPGGRLPPADHERERVLRRYERILMDPFANLSIGIAYLSYLRERYEGRSLYYLLAAYNLGPSKMDKLMARPDFRPDQTLRYYDKIRRGIPEFRSYRSVTHAPPTTDAIGAQG